MNLEKIKQSPIAFLEEVLGITLFKSQKEIIKALLEGKTINETVKIGKNVFTKTIEETTKS